MKNPVESSVVSRSQSETNADKGKMQLALGTTTKLDSIFPLLDQVCIKTRLPIILYIFSAIYLYYQVIFASLYPINKYWYDVFNDTKIFPSNTKVTSIFSCMEKVAFFFTIEKERIETNLLIPIIIFASFFAFSVFLMIFEKFGISHHKIRKLIYHIIRFAIDIVSPVMLIPTGAVFGTSIRNLFLKGDKLNWIYLFVSFILYFVFLLYTYIGFTILNQSTCIVITPFSSFCIKLSIFLPIVCSLFLVFQCICSLFQYWALVIVQLSHLVVSVIVFYPMCYLYFHHKFANIFFNGVTLSTWLNDINFTILFFISPPSKNVNNDAVSDKLHFYYLIGLIVPLFSLVISIVISFFYVKIRIASFLKELNRLNEILNESPNLNNSNNNNMTTDTNESMNILANNKLFKTENLTLMSIHLSFSNCSPLFYHWHVINFAANHYPSVKVLLTIVQYLSFFPGASRKLNNYLKFISQNHDLKYHQRFLLFQIFRIKTMRQSSVSPEANRILSELKNASNQVYEDLISFWDMKEGSVDYLRMIATELTNLNVRWEEAVRDFPNFQKLSDEYCSFLLECQMNLPKALIMKHRSSLIEMGRNFINDVPFLCLAKNYPKYLINGVIDSQGNFKQRDSNNNNNNSASHTFNTQNSSTTTSRANSNSGESNSSLMSASDFELDPELEDSLGKVLLKQSALRIELNRALEHKKNHASRLMLFNCFVVGIIGFGLLIGLLMHLDSYIENRSFSLMYLNVVSKIRYYIDLSILGSTLKFGYDLKFFSQLEFYLQLNSKDDQFEPPTRNVFNIDAEVAQFVIHQNCMISRELLNIFLSGLADLSSKGLADIYSLTRVMMTNIVPFSVCNRGVQYKDYNMSLKALESYMYLLLDQIAAKKVEMSWFFTDEVCEMMANQQAIEDSTFSLFQSLMEYEVSLSDAEDKIIKYLMIIFTIIPLVAYILPEGLYMKLFINDAEKLIKTLLGLSPQYKEIAKRPIRKDSPIEEPQTSEKKVKNKAFKIVLIIMILLCVANSVLIYFMLSETKELNDDIKKLGRWSLITAIRLSHSVQSINYLLISIALDLARSAHLPTPPNAFINLEGIIQSCKNALFLLENANEGLLKGNDLVPPCKGFDKKIDVINIQPSCEVDNNNDTDMHDSYRCVSASQGVGIYISIIRSILEDLETKGASFESEKITHALHLLDRHLLQKLEDSNDIFNVIYMERIAILKKKAKILLSCALILNFLIDVILVYFYTRSLNIYKVGLIYVQRLPPSVFLANKKLLNFILNRKENKNESVMSTTQSVIYMSLDGIVCTNGSGVVEIINPAVTSILGYTPDQMLGQNISVFFASSEDIQETNDNNNNNNNNNEENKEENESGLTGDAERISNQIELMKNGQSALVFQEHFICLTDDEQKMPCGVTILGMTNNHDSSSQGGIVESFVFIIRDETQLMQQQKEAEEAKAQSENLLFQILPRDIVARLNSGEKDISFTVQSASIIFTDVVKFSEYASVLSPQEIMGSLSTMFAAFDVNAKKYDLITKIKLIGDIYMAAAGLFADENVTPKDHAKQILGFGLDCLTVLDEVNIKLNANLMLRVGVNSGGPLLAGVLGTDKPVFDIIGDPINVAARLQTTDVPGKVQIPKSTYDLVCDGDFIIEERGEVFLKGKGKTMSYLVSPGSMTAVLESSTSQQLL